MRTRSWFVSFAVCGLVLLAGAPVSAGSPDRPHSDEPRSDVLSGEADLPTNRPIVAKVVEVDEDAGRITLETPHGQVALSVSQELAERLSPGDVVVLRLTDDDADFPSALPREEPPAADTPAKI